MSIRTRVFFALLTLLACLRAGGMAWNQTLNGPGPGQTPADVIIPEGSATQTAERLRQAGVIASPLTFRIVAHLTRAQGVLHAGEFLIPAHASLGQVLDILRHGSPVQHQVTLPEGLTGAQIAAIINALPAATGTIAAPADCTVLPQTYDYLYGTPRAVILARAETAMTQTLRKAWQNRAAGLPFQSAQQALTLAAIVQEETPLPAELPKVAAVYENRLQLGMKLQADPTVIFAATQGHQSGGASITRSDLANPSPYNTYMHPGLPPGPICAPGQAAIDAVLHPAASDALYFVATGDGGHVFSRNFATQLRNIAAYRAALKAPKSPAPLTPSAQRR